jgi:Flp pilus assembly protein TadG
MRGRRHRWLRLANRFQAVRRLRDGERGQALVEFVLVVPLLLFVLFAIVNFGLMLNQYITVSDAARSGARQLALEQGNNDPCDQAVTVATQAGGSINLSASNVSITFASATGGATSNDYCLTNSSGKPVTTPWPSSTYPSPAGNNSANATDPGAEVQGDEATMTVTKIYPLQFFGFKLTTVTLSSSASDAVE